MLTYHSLIGGKKEPCLSQVPIEVIRPYRSCSHRHKPIERLLLTRMLLKPRCFASLRPRSWSPSPLQLPQLEGIGTPLLKNMLQFSAWPNHFGKNISSHTDSVQEQMSATMPPKKCSLWIWKKKGLQFPSDQGPQKWIKMMIPHLNAINPNPTQIYIRFFLKKKKQWKGWKKKILRISWTIIYQNKQTNVGNSCTPMIKQKSATACTLSMTSTHRSTTWHGGQRFQINDLLYLKFQ